MRLLATAAAAALLALAAAPAMAQDPGGTVGASTQETFSPAHLAAAQKVIALTDSDVVFDDILPRLADQTRDLFIQSNPSLTVEIEEAAGEAALGLAKRRVELSRTVQLVWARRFSEAELVELAAFFETPAGKRFVENSPIISALSLGAARQWETAIAEAMVEDVRAKLREKGYTL